MYENPIKAIMGEMQLAYEGEVMRAVQNCNIIVSKEELVKALSYDRSQYEKGYEDGRKASQQWIPCSERLPEEFAEVICCTDAEEVFIASYLGKLGDGSECFDDGNGMMCEGDVITWMPLPEPMKGEE